MLFDSTLRADLARAFGATLVIILTIVLTMFLIRTVGQAAGGRIAPQDVVLLLGFTALAHLPTMLALSLFIAVSSTLGRMYRDSEMTIWFASGIGLRRFVRPVLRTGWPVLLVVGLLALFVWPWVNQRIAEMKDRFERRSDLSRVAPGQFQSSKDGRRVFFIERDSGDSRIGRNVFILSSQPGAESITTAKTGHIANEGDKRFLVLDRGQRNEQQLGSGGKNDGEKTVSRFESYRLQVGEQALPDDAERPVRAISSLELLLDPRPRSRGELAWRLGLLLGAANLALLAIPLSATNPRRASNWNLMFALLTFVIYYNLINLSQAWITSGKLGMGAALLLFHGGAFTLALLLLWWREQGGRKRRWSLRRTVEAPLS